MNELVDELADRWRHALAAWAIPEVILSRAPASPWIHPPKLFRLADGDGPPPDTPSFEFALDALGSGGTVLDVGCGGGRSSLPLVPPATAVDGVDESEAMLAQFIDAAEHRHITAHTHLGQWPAIAAAVPSADVVVCHHVVYNVGEIVPFVDALTAHARRRVVVELPARHPQSALNPLWEHFWGIARPTEPTAPLFVELLRALGQQPVDRVFHRPARPGPLERAELVAFVRQRLCLSADRDAELDDVLGVDPALSEEDIWTVTWDPC